MKPGNHLIEADGTHSVDCFPCRIKSVQIAPGVVGSTAGAKERDKALERNREAYKRLRMDGLQPKSIHTAEQMETHASETFEVETGRLVSDPAERREYAQAFKDPELHTTPLTPTQSAEIKEAQRAGRKQRAEA